MIGKSGLFYKPIPIFGLYHWTRINNLFYRRRDLMSKKNLLISTALTTFVLVVLANVSAVYARIHDAVSIQATAQPTTTVAEALPAQNQVAQVTHQEAANIAASFLGQNDLYSVENAIRNGMSVYKVVFSSGTIVYVSMDGQVLGSETPQPVVISAPVQNNPASSAVSFTENHKDRDDHEDHDN
jgi:hypothetical protein